MKAVEVLEEVVGRSPPKNAGHSPSLPQQQCGGKSVLGHAHPESPGPLTFLGSWGASEELVGDIVECRELSCVPEDALGSLRLQQDRVRCQAAELHLHGSQRQPGHTPEQHAASGDDNRGTQK